MQNFISLWSYRVQKFRNLSIIRINKSTVLFQGRDATPYLERNRVGRDAIDSAAALTDMGKYLFRERRLPVYDIAVAITKWVKYYQFCVRFFLLEERFIRK